MSRTARRNSLSWLLLIALLAPSVSHAVTVDGKWGIGFEETLISIADSMDKDSANIAIPASGLVLHKFVGYWDFEVVLGARAQISFSEPTQWAGFVSLGGHYSAFRAPRANLSLGVRLITGVHRPVDEKTKKSSELNWGLAIEAPLRAVFFLSDHFAISGAVGVVAALEMKNRHPLTGGTDAVKVQLFKGGFSGGIGFAFLFD